MFDNTLSMAENDDKVFDGNTISLVYNKKKIMKFSSTNENFSTKQSKAKQSKVKFLRNIKLKEE